MARNADPTFVYIVGKGHSGSTMLELLLNRSTNVAAMGEIDMLALQIYRDERTRWVGKCSCGERPQNCPVWGKVIDDVRERSGVDLVRNPFGWRISDVGVEEEYGLKRPFTWASYKFHRAIRSLAYRGSGHRAGPFTAHYRQWIENRDHVARKFAELQGVEAVVDASKDPLQMRDIVAYSQLPVRILFLTRDVRGLAWSAVKRQRNTALREAKSWRSLNGRILQLLEGVDPKLWMQVSYEEICADVEGTMERIHEFIGVERRALTPEEERASRHTIAGNQTRLRDLGEIREDQAWRDGLSPTDINAVLSQAGSLATRLGYEL